MTWSRFARAILATCTFGAWASLSPVHASTPIPVKYVMAASLHGIEDPSILYAIAMQESGRFDRETGLLKPWPWALNVDGQGYYFDDMAEVWDALSNFLQDDPKHIGIGLVQVTWPFNGDLLWEPYTALDPGTNLTLGAHILRECYDRLGDWWRAVGCYHSPTPKNAVAYRQKIYRHWLALRHLGTVPTS